jgi:thymidylate synthase
MVFSLSREYKDGKVDLIMPLLTTKKVNYENIVKELLWFVNAQTDSKVLEAQGVNIWKDNTTRDFLDKRGLKHYQVGDAGPCFTTGTKVLTDNGYKNIEDVDDLDKLYTHHGRYQPINEIMIRDYSGPMIQLKVRYHPHPIYATPEHPFYARPFTVRDRVGGKRNVVYIRDPEWVKAEDLNHSYMLGMKVNTNSVIPEFDYDGRTKTLDNLDEWFMMGYFLGDGWVVSEDTGDRIYFAINDKQEHNLVTKIRKILNIQKCTTYAHCFKYRCINREYAYILKQFGKYADGKKIPEWVHDAPKEYIQAFLDGYCSADGYVSEKRSGVNDSKRFTTISQDIALSLQRLYLKLGKFTSINFQKRGYYKEIQEGKHSFCKDCYGIEVYESKSRRNTYCFIEGEYAWFTISELSIIDVTNEKVYNFDVAEDHTYTVENLSVHNCYGFQWRHFGAPYRGAHADYRGQGVDQLQNIIDTIRKDPYDRRLVLSAWNPTQLKDMALPPCFMAGTLTLTSEGYKPIEEVSDTDQLYTHNGIFKPIETKHITDYSGEVIDLDIAYHPHIITTTPDHPFYARKVINGQIYDPEWVPAKKIGPFHYVGLKVNNLCVIPEFSITKNTNQYSDSVEYMKLDQSDYWFMMGFFLGDGWVRKNDPKRAKIFFSMNDADMKVAYPRIEKVFKLCHLKPSEYTTNCFKLQAHNQFWYKILSEFGQGAKNKRIPEWVQSAPLHLIEEFLHGYNVADGSFHSGKSGINISTTSVNIALGLQRLYAKLGIVIGSSYRDPRPKVIIQGREVKESRLYSIQKTFGRDRRTRSFIKDGYVWFYVINYITRPVKDLKVYNFAVQDDHTYTVENLTVHNCHMSAVFNVDPDPKDHSANPKPKYLNCLMTQRSADVPLGVPYNIASYATLTHMIAYLTGLIAKELVIVTADTHVYENQVEACAIQLDREPRPFPTLSWNFSAGSKPQKIEDFKVEHFRLNGYDPHPAIKFPFAI